MKFDRALLHDDDSDSKVSISYQPRNLAKAFSNKYKPRDEYKQKKERCESYGVIGYGVDLFESVGVCVKVTTVLFTTHTKIFVGHTRFGATVKDRFGGLSGQTEIHAHT